MEFKSTFRTGLLSLGFVIVFSMVAIRDIEPSTSLVTIGTQNGLGCLGTVYHSL